MLPHHAAATCLGLLSLLCLGTGHAADTAARQVREELPGSVVPERYRIDFKPDASALEFTGTVEIDVRVRESVDRIELNAVDLVIDRSELLGQDGAPRVSYDSRHGRVVLRLPNTLRPGPYTIRLAYHGTIYTQTSGLFALDYRTRGGSARALFTQFENVDARRFVPCWDEPARKAVFELSATLPAGEMAVSNMPVAQAELLPGGLQHVRFEPTPRMSSYLLFFAAGDFERRTRNVDGVEIGAVVKRGELSKADFVLDAAADMLHYYNEYFGVRYPLPKLDFIAGPGSSASYSAMENWGAIFSFESDMLIDSRIASEGDRQRAYLVAAHEMAHQWFGDLVTMRWWDDLWLNEGFASWMENKATDRFHPEWNFWLKDLGERQRAMVLDARHGTHPVIPRILNANEAVLHFDEIAYHKGDAIIRTLEAYVGESAFRDGVRRYIRERAYGNAVTDDLWRVMDLGAVRPVTQIARDLTLQAGVPLIRERSARCAAGGTTLRLSQGQFVLDAAPARAPIWHVPVRAATLGNAPGAAVISGANAAPMRLDGCGPVLINAGGTAYFRTLYRPEGLAELTRRYGELAPADQLDLLYDTQSLSYQGAEPISALASLAAALPGDAVPEVTDAWANALDGLNRLGEGLPVQASLRDFSREVLERQFAHLGWDAVSGEPANVALAREAVIVALSHLDDRPIVGEARQRFARFLADPSSFDAASRDLVLQAVAAAADQGIWSELHERARTADSELERYRFYQLLTLAGDSRLVQKALELTLGDELPPALVPEVIRAAAGRHPRLAFDFTSTHWRQLAPRIEPDSRITFVPALLRGAHDDAALGSLRAFAAEYIPPDGRQEVAKTEASVRYASRVRRERLPALAQWLKASQLRSGPRSTAG